MLSKASERLPFRNVSLKLGNGRDLGMYPDAKFDAVFSLLMLQHLEKEDAFLTCWRSIGCLRKQAHCCSVPEFTIRQTF